MSPRPTVLPRLLIVLALLAVAAMVGAPASGAAGSKWGDLGHFGELESEIRHGEGAFGVNPGDGSVWLVDVTLVGKEEELRLQKFEQVAGAWTSVASRVIGVNEAPTGTTREVDGLAFDARENRVYLLMTEERIKAPHKEEEAVASELLAFSTVTSGGAIEPASGTKAGGVLVPRTETNLTGSPVGKSELSPNSTEKGMTLFAPGGIAVNPTNDQILLTGWVGGEAPEMWAVSDSGEIKTVWEDKTGYFEKGCGCLSSPVVTSAGKILVMSNHVFEIVELPSTLNSATAPKRAVWMPREIECGELQREKEEGKGVETCTFFEKLTRIESGAEAGGEMSLGPEGNLYVHAVVKNLGEGGFEDGAVLIFNPSLQEIGWTGGGSWGSATKQCAVNETDPGNLGSALVAGYEAHEGKEAHVFMYERGNPVAGEHSKVLELGPEGKTENCPQGSATKPTAEAGGAKLSSFPIADTVTLTSKVTQANALSTEWELEPGVTQNVGKRQQDTTLVEHQFASEGTFNVIERIHSDDLATPLIEVSEKVTIVAPKVRGEAATPEGTTLALKAEVNPTGSLTKCSFQYAEASEPFSGAGVKSVTCPTAPGEEEKWVAETVKVGGLTAGKRYHFRLLAKAGAWEGKQAGTEVELPLPGAPVAETKPASEVGSFGATLNGAVNPKGKETKACKFEYGTELPSGKTVACATSPGGGEASVPVSATVTGLLPSTTYKFKLLDENTEGKASEGSTLSFPTLEAPSAPAAETLAATGIGQTAATLKGLVNPHGEATSCRFEYGTTTAYGTTVACPTAPGAGRSSVEESAPLSGLLAGTAYHFRIVAENGKGKTPGADKELRTAPASEPPHEEPKPQEKHEVLPAKLVSPEVKAAGAAVTVAAGGSFSLKLSCPASAASCAGTVTIKTLSAVAARSARAAKAKKAILTLATGRFTITGGKLAAVTLHLSAKAKKLLAKMHTLRAKATFAATNPEGATQTTTALLTLKAAKKKH
ncbi:MAG TPA: hypothetical protein VN618_10010 [Solirubrobacteraceae bacterium]|nr:hypothetical protein [Solirubrobacteraceae bacterium]